MMKLALFKVSIAVAGAALLAGCATTRVHKGTVINEQLAIAIQPVVDNKDSVAKLLGRPTFTGEFTPNDWYYVSRDARQIAFRNPHVMNQTVLHIRFDAKGNVLSVDRTGKELVMNVDPTGRITPTLGRKKSFFDELFGNIGTVGSGGLGGPTSPQQ
jgi:outer membrane protein assembly factor BamE (lipoprotein component of BamABCDE complex)